MHFIFIMDSFYENKHGFYELNFKSINGNLVISFKDKNIKDTITISNFFKDKNDLALNNISNDGDKISVITMTM